MIYELREYVAMPGQGARLHARFRDHTLALFERHRLEVVGFWTDEADPERVVYLLRFPDRQALDQRWAAFKADPDWQRVKAESEADGPIVAEMTARELSSPAYWRSETAAASTSEGVAAR
ncbi:MAG: NIPSNAP family protein [Micromonosporaceae bacterium]